MFGKLAHHIAAHVMVVVVRPEGMAVYPFPVAIDQHPVLVGTYQKPLETIEVTVTGRTRAEERIHSSTGCIGIFDYRRLLRIRLKIMHPVGRRDHRLHITRPVLPIQNIVQCITLCGCRQQNQCRQCSQKYLSHLFFTLILQK